MKVIHYMENVSVESRTEDNTSSGAEVYTYYYSDDEIMELVKEHIRLPNYEWIYVVLFITVFFIGIIGNFLVCYSVMKNKNMKVLLNFFLVNLAVADFLVILICLPSSVAFDVLQSWFLGAVMCKITSYLQVSESILILQICQCKTWGISCIVLF